MLYLKKAVAIEEEYALMNVMMIGVYILRPTRLPIPPLAQYKKGLYLIE